MNLPRVLLVDDQFARNATERKIFLDRAGLIEAGTRANAATSAVAESVVCSGQREDGNRLVNDYRLVIEAAAIGGWGLVLLDMQFDSGRLDASGRPTGQAGDDSYGKTILEHLSAQFPDLPVVVLSGKRHLEIGDVGIPYLSKLQLNPYEMRRALLRFGTLSPEQAQIVLGLGERVLARDPASLAAFRQAFVHAGTDVSILILGESGVGKEVLARYVHDASTRSNGPFVALNVAAIPRELVESELFGIGKNVATGVARRPGKFELASGGTLFLDEIGDMPLDTQAKVLRALQERRIVRVGEAGETDIDIRLICATSRNLGQLVETGAFRSDLLYRINTVPITIPPLRERREDIEPLAGAFLRKFAEQQNKSGLSFGEDALRMLQQQAFPGNVRELENLVASLASSAGHHQVIGRRDVADALGQGDILPGTRIPKEESANPTLPTRAEPVAQLTLDEALAALNRIVIRKDDPALKGAKPRLDVAMRVLLQRLAGAALERYRDPDDGTLNRQRAMQLLTGDPTLKGKGPARVINEILGRLQDTGLSDDDLEGLIRQWRAGDGHVDE